MIVKHFYHNIWHLGENWENTDHVFGAPDPDLQVEQNERSIAASLEISDDEHDMEEEEEEDESLSLPSHRHTQNTQASPWRVRRVGK
jgi:hypothetical protein